MILIANSYHGRGRKMGAVAQSPEQFLESRLFHLRETLRGLDPQDPPICSPVLYRSKHSICISSVFMWNVKTFDLICDF